MLDSTVNTSEAYRHQCEVREWIRLRLKHGVDWVRRQMVVVEKKRGAEAARKLRADLNEQWFLGNRGEQGDWRFANKEAA